MKKKGQNEQEIAFADFFKQNYVRLYYYALTYVSNEETCKDIVGESFRHLWERIDTFCPESALSYMFVHVHNLCIDHIRHTAVEHTYIESYLDVVAEMNEASWKESEDRMEIIWKIIEEMPVQTRFCMEQCYFHKKKYKEVAQILGLTESGVRKHIMKGLDMIRARFSVKYKKGQ